MRHLPSNTRSAVRFARYGWIYALVSGCSLSLDAQRTQCVTDDDCAGLTDAAIQSVCVARFCVAQKQAPVSTCENRQRLEPASTRPFKVKFRLRDVVTNEPLANMRSKLCNKLDVNCDDPQSAEVISDSEGNTSIEIRPGFIGYLEITGEQVGTGVYFFNPAVEGDHDFGVIELISVPVARVVAAQTGASFSPDRGLLLLRSVDCSGTPIAGIRYQMNDYDAIRRAYYSVDGLPSTAATATDRDGYGGFVNVKPGIVTVAVYDSTDEVMEPSVSLLVRPGTVTYGYFSLLHGP